ncbi:MAG: SRPBCC family protein [Acidimicrobiales bacterium]|nr:SRPBCC family protein [Acidimicrobiales bacterium]HRW36991.1 SRPBCC family protein [Aquihabitans sp.]
MASPLHVSCSRTYPVPADRAYELTVAWPLEELFHRRYGPIPPIVGTDQDGEWGTFGQVRTIHLADGGSMQERLTTVEPPHRFGYEITGVTGPMKPLAARIEGTWAFEEVGTGCRITWTWVIHPASSASGLVLPVFGRIWKGYARRALDHLEALLLGALDR